MKKKSNPFSRGVFRIVRFAVRLCYGNIRWMGRDNSLSKVIYVANHAQIHGPIIGELFMGDNCYTWCAGEVMNRREFPRYAMEIFWPASSEKGPPVCKALSHCLAPLAACLFTNARTVEVRRDYRIKKTFRDSLALLEQGCNLLIFPESDDPCNDVVNAFHENFVDLARHYYKNTGECLSFVPVYNAPGLKTSCMGEPIVYQGENSPETERKRIVSHLTREIARLAHSLPEHEVVPFRPKR